MVIAVGEVQDNGSMNAASPMLNMSTNMTAIIRYLQGWIGMVGLTALGNTFSCYKGHDFLSERLYTGAPTEVNALMGRLFGTWTLLSAILRIYCAFNIHNRGLYNMTLVSFVLAFVHFLSEATIYGTAPATTLGVIMPLVISGVSVIWMLVVYRSLFQETKLEDFDKPVSMEDILLQTKQKKYMKSK